MPQDGDTKQLPAGKQPEPSQTQGDQQQGDSEFADYIKQLRQEAANYRKKLREAEQLLTERDTQFQAERAAIEKKVSETERKLIDAERAHKERVIEYEAKLLAVQRGVVDPDAAYKLLDLAKVKLGDDGKPVGLDDALNELVKAKPYLLSRGTGAPAPAAGNPPRMGTITAAQLRDRKFYEEHRDEIMQAMREGRIVSE
jgi:hypothetical protein